MVAAGNIIGHVLVKFTLPAVAQGDARREISGSHGVVSTTLHERELIK